MNDPLCRALQEFDTSDPVARSRRIWDLFVEAEQDLTPAMDWALENGLVTPLVAERLLLQHRARLDSGLWVEPNSGIEMIWIWPGPANNGLENAGEDTGPMQGFSLARHPVTESQWTAFVAATGYQDDTPRQHPQWPVTHVHQGDALAWCQWAGLDLPTEWMWERAARGDDLRDYPWGSQYPRDLCHVRAETPIDVGSFPRVRTAFGCQDMIGNVIERCVATDDDDRLKLPAQRTPIPQELDGTGPVRGSAYIRYGMDRGRMMAAYRRQLGLGNRNAWCGFRPAFASVG